MELVTRCDSVDAVVALGFIGVPSAVADERPKLPVASTTATQPGRCLCSSSRRD